MDAGTWLETFDDLSRQLDAQAREGDWTQALETQSRRVNLVLAAPELDAEGHAMMLSALARVEDGVRLLAEAARQRLSRQRQLSGRQIAASRQYLAVDDCHAGP